LNALAATHCLTPDAVEEPPPRLVIVDDDRYIVSLLDDLFRQEGMDVHSFTSSREAQSHIAAEAPDIVITDIKMPEVSGLELLREIKERHPETLVIMITGYSTLQTTLESVTLGAFDYITKPFVLGEVKLVVQRAAEQMRLRRENQRLADRLAEMEHEFNQMRENFETLTREFDALGEALRTRAVPGEMQPRLMPQSPVEALKPYAAAARTAKSRYSEMLVVLEQLRASGVLSDADFAAAKRRLAEATGHPPTRQGRPGGGAR
jgi:DNA-binding response OmpR family regulator